MFYEFEEEIKLLNESNVKDKERIIYIFTDFYKEIICTSAFINIEHKQIFIEMLKEIFRKTIIKAEENSYANYYNFIKNIINETYNFLANNDFQKNNPNWFAGLQTVDRYLAKIFPVIENEYLNMLNLILGIFNTSLSEMNFYTKAHILLYLKEQINSFTTKYNLVYNPSNTNKDADKTIKTFTCRLIRKLPDIIEESYGFEEFHYNLQKETYLLLQEEFELKNPGFNNFNTYVFKDYYVSLDSNSKNIFRKLIMEYLSGYTDNNNLENSLFGRLKQGHTRRKVKKELKKLGYTQRRDNS